MAIYFRREDYSGKVEEKLKPDSAKAVENMRRQNRA
jgi:hypothetical protein